MYSDKILNLPLNRMCSEVSTVNHRRIADWNVKRAIPLPFKINFWYRFLGVLFSWPIKKQAFLRDGELKKTWTIKLHVG